MKLSVFFSPAELKAVKAAENDIYIVIDVIRATTSLAVIFERDVARVLIAGTVDQARRAADLVPGRLLCGERHALPLPGFDYGNSPVQFAQADIAGRELVLTTTNGTRAFFACPDKSVRLAGCFYNAQAVITCALAQARECQGNIVLLCAAEAGYFALDDAACAGHLAQEALRQDAAIQTHESALAAMALAQAYPPAVIIETSNSAHSLRKWNMEKDLQMCIRVDGGSRVPMVVGQDEDTEMLVLGLP